MNMALTKSHDGRPISECKLLAAKRAWSAKYIVAVGDSPYRPGRGPYWSSLGIYDDWRSDGYRQWNPCTVIDLDLETSGIATLEEAVRECDAIDTSGAYVVELATGSVVYGPVA